MTNPTKFDPITLEDWTLDDKTNLLFQTELTNYLQNYFSCFRCEPQWKLFKTFIHGLLSPLDRKFIELITLHFSGIKYVRPMQQFSRSPFDEKPVLKTYQKLLYRQIRNGSGMLSVNNTEFVKKRRHSVGVKAVLWPSEKDRKLPVRCVPCLCRSCWVRPCWLWTVHFPWVVQWRLFKAS